jgi:hypothetical protein
MKADLPRDRAFTAFHETRFCFDRRVTMQARLSRMLDVILPALELIAPPPRPARKAAAKAPAQTAAAKTLAKNVAPAKKVVATKPAAPPPPPLPDLPPPPPLAPPAVTLPFRAPGASGTGPPRAAISPVPCSRRDSSVGLTIAGTRWSNLLLP